MVRTGPIGVAVSVMYAVLSAANAGEESRDSERAGTARAEAKGEVVSPSLLTIPKEGSRRIRTKRHQYDLGTWPLPFKSYAASDKKPVGYLERIGREIVVAAGNGRFFIGTIPSQTHDTMELTEIPSNFARMAPDERLYAQETPANFQANWVSIRDILFHDGSLLVAYTKEEKKDCYNTSILASKWSRERLQFKEIFTYDECQPALASEEFNGQQSGGRMAEYKGSRILFSIGEYRNRTLAQKPGSLFGKVIAIDVETTEHSLVSMGHRNVQGLVYLSGNDVIVMTEHGPKGGDEVNVNTTPGQEVENYGWPQSSYGEHYDDRYRKEAPLHNSHREYGYKEPVRAFVPSIGISDIKNIPGGAHDESEFLMASMGRKSVDSARSLYRMRFDDDFNEVRYEEVIPIGERIRDILVLEIRNTVILLLEDKPAIGILEVEQ